MDAQRLSRSAQSHPPRERGRLAEGGIELATVHALVWLAVVCSVGMLLSVLLVAPDLGRILGPLTYGRWTSLHLNLALYGWLALPLVALLFRTFGAERGAEVAVQVWSGSLMVGAIGWLSGEATGKAFLDWSGVSRVVFLLSQLVLAGVLAAGLVGRKTRELGLERRFEWPDGSRPWLLALLAWSGALLGTVPMFLPGLLDRIKPTNALVGHLAMAGAASSFAALILVVVNDRTRLRGCLNSRGSFALWHGGNALQVAALVAAGCVEAMESAAMSRGEMAVTVCSLVRALGGAAMLAASWRWAAAALRRFEVPAMPEDVLKYIQL